MSRVFQEMTLDELWALFPIVLLPHHPNWTIQAEAEMGRLWDLLHHFHPAISHIGSTAVPGLAAKPIVDILIETPSTRHWQQIEKLLTENGYILMACGKVRMSFNKGYTEAGYAEEVYHIHFHLEGDNDEILFRDFLRAYPSVGKDYERLKFSLLKIHGRNRDAYTEAKSDFVKQTLAKAKASDGLDEEEIQVENLLKNRAVLSDIKRVAEWAEGSDANMDYLWRCSLSENSRLAVNSLWVMTHVDGPGLRWLRDVQGRLILRLLDESYPSKKRIYLQLLREQEYDLNAPLTIRLLDYCLSKINAECEPYAVRCFSLYTAFRISRVVPELLYELNHLLSLLATQNLSPGLRSAHRQISRKMARLMK